MKYVFYLFSICLLSAPLFADDVPVFENDILPILEMNCLGCHGKKEPQAGLVMESIATLMNGSNNGSVVIPGKSDESRLYRLISGQDKPTMPPKPLLPLTDDEIALIKKWIDGGTPSIESPKPKPQKEESSQPKPAKPKPEPKQEKTPEPVEHITAAPIDTSEPLSQTQIGSVAFHPSKPILAVGRLYEVQLYEIDADTQTISPIAVLPGHSHVVRALAFSPDGKILAAAGGRPAIEGEIVLWDVATQTSIRTIKGHDDNIYAVSFSPDGKTLASCSYDRLIKLWDVESGKEIKTLKDHIDAVYDVQFSPDGARLASVAGDRTLKIWDVATGKRLYTLSQAEKELYTVAFHPDGKTLAASGLDRMIRIFHLGKTNGEQVEAKFAHDGAVLKLKYSPDGSVLYSTSDDRTIKAWDTKTYLETVTFEPQSDWTYGFDLDPQGRWLAAGRYDGTFAVYDAKTGENLNLSLSKKLSQAPMDSSPTKSKPKESEPKEKTKASYKNDNQFRVNVLEGTGTYPSYVSYLTPNAFARGKTIAMTVHGKNLDDSEILADDPKIKVKLLDTVEKPIQQFQRQEFTTASEIVDTGRPFELKIELTVPDDARTGIHRLRVRTPLATTNALPFLVESEPAIAENESNDSLDTAQTVALPGIVTGSMNQQGDIDYFAFEAHAGDELVFQIIGSPLGSGLQSVMKLLAENGDVLADSDAFGKSQDALLAHRFERDGTYTISITDNLFRGGGFYRLHVTRRPFVTQAYPLGVPHGATSEIQVHGFNLGGKDTVALYVPDNYGSDSIDLPIQNDGGGLVKPVRLEVVDTPVVEEKPGNDSFDTAMKVELPVTINGTIADTNPDCYRFHAEQGETWIFDVAAQRFGSPLDSVIDITHSDGRPVEIATVRCVAETFVTLSGRDSRTAGIRLDSWKDLQINDYVMIGSEIIRIEKLPDYPDEDILFFRNERRGWRKGFFGTTPASHAVDTKAYKVEIHPAGKTFPPNGLPVYPLYARNDDGGAPTHESDSYFRFTVPETGDYAVKLTDALGQCSNKHEYSLSIRKPKPDFRIYTGADRVNIPKGGRIAINVVADRLDGFDGEIQVEVPDLPKGFTGTMGRILPGEESVTITIAAEDGATSTDPDARFTVNGHALIDGGHITHQSSFGAITVTKQPDIVVKQEPKQLVLAPGRTVKVHVKTKRQNGFEGRIPISAVNLPHGVYVLDTGLNGILINEDETERTYTIYAEPWVDEVSIPVFSQVSVETRSRLSNTNATAMSILKITRDENVLAQSDDEFLQQKTKF